MGRNRDYFFELGRGRRLSLETAIAEGRAEAGSIHDIPLMSHDGTMQSAFTKGWKSCTPGELFAARQKTLFTELSENNARAADYIAQLRARFKEQSCHSR